MPRLRLRLLAPAAAAVAALALAAPAAAQSGTYSTYTLREPASRGLAVTGPLSDLVATSGARLVAPAAWRRREAPAGRRRFRVTQNRSCRYNVTYSVRSVLAAPQDTTAYVEGLLPAESSRHVLDSGARGNRAFRVVRQRSSGGRIRVDALWAGVLTRRADIAPAGQVAWTQIRVVATSRAGDECHSGTWRESLGPAIGDSLAVARARLRFTR